ncbi:adenylyl cyclase-associated protein 1 [Callorhinchus milii]|uniref:Adenylyl cyclase-associated protein n=1 Tax=Callorhinchus milii TaxID=7868 RepID=V9K9I5_CALMI|nr:adenylyl cyclase-associated protein 1 [Callorhinchus milii]|eukprot:gi/632980270/ref/XP_007906941.1/ PREDICTED: adenylyl cyclase-associated protein 1 [Callorhinchus milii]
MEALIQRLETAVIQLETVVQSGVPGAGSVDTACAAYVEEFDEILAGPVAEYYKQSKGIGGDVFKHAEMVTTGLNLQRKFLVIASQCQKPSEAELTQILQPISAKIQEIQDFREKNRPSKQFNHLSAVSESIPALGWLTVAPKPGPFVKEMNDAAMFYTNRVLKDYKETDKKHVDWVKAYLKIWADFQAYIKANHTTGVSWSKTGKKATAAKGCGMPGGPAPPTAPAPPPFVPATAASPKHDDSQARSALFDQLNKGDNITSGLKHVSDNMKTHKNEALRNQKPLQTGPKPFVAKTPTPSKPAAKKQPPVLELEGKKWKVENQENVKDLVIGNTQLGHVVYIYKCAQSTVTVKGKINSIIVDNCKKLGLVFEDVVGIVEVINCRDVKIQVLGKVPTVSINKTDGCHTYLSKDSLNCEIISAKSSEMNILVPVNDDFIEHAVPEQFKTVWNGKKLVTTVTEISG